MIRAVREKYPIFWNDLRFAPEEILFFALERYVDEHTNLELYRMDGRISLTTRRLADMRPGDTLLLGPQAPQTARARMVTARTILNNPEAKWRMQKAPGGYLVTRVPDGSDVRGNPILSGITQELISAKIGEPFISSARRPANVGSNHRAVARRYLGAPSAEWRTKMINGRLNILRTK